MNNPLILPLISVSLFFLVTLCVHIVRIKQLNIMDTQLAIAKFDLEEIQANYTTSVAKIDEAYKQLFEANSKIEDLTLTVQNLRKKERHHQTIIKNQVKKLKALQ